MTLKYIEEAPLKGKRVLVRFDFNVPLKDGKITDTTRVDSTLPTIKYILEQGASKLILMSHLGRPDGQINKKYTLEPVAAYLAEKLHQEVVLTETAIDENIPSLIKFPDTKIVLLENLRFHAEEEGNGAEFCRTLASYADLYVNDAFGTSHRKHASVYGINSYFKNAAYGGFLLKQEVEALMKITNTPARPMMAIVGGAKISDKIKTLERLMSTVDKLIIGGAMAYPFLRAQGHRVGNSLCAESEVELARKILTQPTAQKLLLPIDHVVAASPDGAPTPCSQVDIADGMMGLDIGPKSVEQFASALAPARTIFWNGPMGLFERDVFAKGTFAMARVLADSSAFTLIGGGDSVSAINKSGLADKISHISTGGGASLEFIEKGELPGIQALRFGIN